MSDVERVTVGSARRRRERRLRSWWRLERVSIAPALVPTHHSAPRSGWPGTHEAPRVQGTTSVRKDPELFTLFEEELAGCRPDRLAVSEPQGSLPREARTLSAPLWCVPRLDEGCVAVDSSALAFLEVKEEEVEEKRMGQLEDMTKVPKSAPPMWRPGVVGQPTLLRRGKKEEKEEEEEEAAEDFFRSFFLSYGAQCAENLRVSLVQFLVVDVLCSCSDVRGGHFDAMPGSTVDTFSLTARGAFGRISHIF